MNREIKFRAWDDDKKTFFNPLHHNCYDFDEIQARGLYEISQFTNLQDKNGKDIYEGDIVQRGVITFSRGKFQGTYYDSNGNLEEDWEDDLYQERNIEVLGNIYENPELLTPQNNQQ